MLARLGIGRVDLELVLAPPEVDLDAPRPGRIGRRLARPAGGLDGDRAARDRRAHEDVRGGALVDGEGGDRRRRDGDRRRLVVAQDLDGEVGADEQDDDRQERGNDDARRERQAAPGWGDRSRNGDDRLRRCAVAAFAAPLDEDLVGVEAEVQGVVAEESLRVDGSRQLLVVAPLECPEIARANLRVALGPVEIDALAFSGGVEPLGERRAGVGGRGRQSFVRPRPQLLRSSPRLVPCRHRSRSSSASSPSGGAPAGAAPSRRSTARAFDPSNAPM